ncbi:MAG: hypothetical protein WBA74_19570, partial [Cyclobacteriaceae bacterium]
MILTLQLGNEPLRLIAILFLLASCTPKVEILDKKKLSTSGYNENFKEYCGESARNLSDKAILASFVGDYQNSVSYAAERNLLDFRLNTIDEIENLKTIFEGYSCKNAKEHIIEESRNYHFTLINEAHYSSKNRVFTQSLLKPLWENGYRYLALEALGYNDPNLNNRSFPTDKSGFYLKEISFGNLVREALSLGYKLVPYETKIYDRGDTFRDQQQAQNLIAKTWQQDKKGKVLVHVGYGHLGEIGDDQYAPMGYQLKKMVGQDILTVDQQTMLPLKEDKSHAYYQYASNICEITQPIIFLKQNKKI